MIQNEKLFSFLSFFFNGGGWLVSIGIWFWYAYYCQKNNEALNNDPKILMDRAWWIQHHKERGDFEEFKRVIGIQ